MLVLSLTVYLLRAYFVSKRSSANNLGLSEVDLKESLQLEVASGKLLNSIWLNIFLVIVAFSMLIVGSKVFVENAVALARALHVSELVIGLTNVSVGTSLPELITSLMAARRGSVDIAVGNVIGSNIFNMLGILGVCAIIKPQAVEVQSLLLDVPLLLIVSLAMLPIMKSDGEISRKEGFMLFFGYLIYVSVLLKVS